MCNSYGVEIFILYAFVYAVKMLTGHQRPFFFEVCKPDVMKNCTPGIFITNYQCTNSEAGRELTLSFFSLHAALFIFNTTFLAYYLQKKFSPKHKIILPFCQLILLIIGYFGAISRLLDHHHHANDVIAGTIFGLILSIHAVSYKVS